MNVWEWLVYYYWRLREIAESLWNKLWGWLTGVDWGQKLQNVLWWWYFPIQYAMDFRWSTLKEYIKSGGLAPYLMGLADRWDRFWWLFVDKWGDLKDTILNWRWVLDTAKKALKATIDWVWDELNKRRVQLKNYLLAKLDDLWDRFVEYNIGYVNWLLAKIEGARDWLLARLQQATETLSASIDWVYTFFSQKIDGFITLWESLRGKEYGPAYEAWAIFKDAGYPKDVYALRDILPQLFTLVDEWLPALEEFWRDLVPFIRALRENPLSFIWEGVKERIESVTWQRFLSLDFGPPREIGDIEIGFDMLSFLEDTRLNIEKEVPPPEFPIYDWLREQVALLEKWK